MLQGGAAFADALSIEDSEGNDLSQEPFLPTPGAIFGQESTTYTLRNIGNNPITNVKGAITQDGSFGFNAFYSSPTGFQPGDTLGVGESVDYIIAYDLLAGLEAGATVSFTGGSANAELLETPLFSRSRLNGRDIGNTGATGSTEYVSLDQYTLTAGGSHLGLGPDSYHFATSAFHNAGDRQIEARVDSVTDAGLSRAGVMVRDTSFSNSDNAFVYIWMQPDKRVSMQYRDTNGTHLFLNSEVTGSAIAGDTINPKWVRLKRIGNTFTGLFSANGYDWEKFASIEVAMNNSAEYGLAANAGDFLLNSETTANFSELSIADINSSDIGNPQNAGSTVFANDIYTLTASGSDVWHSSDQFQFRSQKLLSDGEVVTRVDSLVRRHFWSKSGVMFRASSDADAANVFVFMRPDKRVGMQVRPAAGAASLNITNAQNITGDSTNFKWVKITRLGNTFSGYYSIDGSNWIFINSVDVEMPIHTDVGLALTSHNNGSLTTSEYSNFSVNKHSSILEACWEMDVFGTQTPDISGNRHHATVNNVTSDNGILGGAINFSGFNSYANIPKETFNVIGDEISIAMWAKGNPDQPRNDSVIYATNSLGNRVLNIHLPWSNSRVYWDCGVVGSSYDRIQKLASSNQFKNVWNHWVFTKNANTGSMSIYLNGNLWHSGSGKTRTIKDITDATISAGVNSPAEIRSYSGSLDSIQVYRVELTSAEITELYNSYTPE